MSALNGSWIEIFKAGDYGQRGAWTADDLDRIAAAYNPRLHQAPVVLGHPATDAPAYGWVARLRRAGQSLWAQLEKVDPAFEQLLRAGRFRQRSVALYRNFPPTGGAYLRHLGFLGAQPPAVKGLAPVRFLNAPAFSFTEPLPAAAELLVAHDLPAGPDAPSVKAKPETPMFHSKLENFLNHLRSFFSPEASPTPTHGEESLPAGSAADSSPPASLADESLAAEVAGESSGDESHGDSSSAVSSLVGHGFSRANRTAGRRPTTEGVRGKPSRVSPDAAPEQTDLAAFAERVAQLEQRLDSLTVERNTAQKKFAATETAARQADVARFADSLRAAGRFPPVFDHWGVAEFMERLTSADTVFAEAQPISSGEEALPRGDSSAAVPEAQPLLSWFQDFLTKLPAVIEFRELTVPASYGSRGTEREPRLVPFAEPSRGMEIDPASVELAERAEALAAELGVTYAEALTQLRQEHRHTHISA
jgi:hypothetical protein